MSQEVADRIAVQDVMLTYTKAVDEKDYELYYSLFTADLEVVGMGAETIHGLDVFYEWWKKALSAYGNTQHMLGPTLATIEGDYAKTRTDVQAHHYLIDDPEKTLTLWATYYTDMKRGTDGWKICRHELVSRGVRAQ